MSVVLVVVTLVGAGMIGIFVAGVRADLACVRRCDADNARRRARPAGDPARLLECVCR